MRILINRTPRICQGRYFALNALFITVANILACFDIRPLDMDGKPSKRVNESFTGGLLL
jgi:hypothetical protein